MKIQYIGVNDKNNCYFMNCDGVGILLDFPIGFRQIDCKNDNFKSEDQFNLFSMDFYLPHLEMIDLCALNVVLVSNVYSMIALPFLTERMEFTGKIYATSPIYELGKLLMKDFILNIRSSKSVIKQSLRENQLQEPESVISNFYSEDEMDSCLSKINQVSFCDNRNIKFGVYVTAISSGHHFGSCNWIIQNNNEKICYLSASSLYKTHAIPLQTQYMNDLDFLIVSQLAQCDIVRPDSLIQSIFDRTMEAVRDGGCVLFPTYPTGFIYDLIQLLSKYLTKENYSNLPIYCISSVITASLSYSNISAEWLNNERLEISYSGSTPFEHQTLIDKKRIICLKSLADIGIETIRNPCIVLATNPLLICGPSRDLFIEWCNYPQNCCIFTDPNYFKTINMNKFQHISMKCYEIPVDTRLSYLQLSNLINDIKPRKVILPEQDCISFCKYIKNSETELKIDYRSIIKLKYLSRYQSNDTKQRDLYEIVYVPSSLADEIVTGPYTNHESDEISTDSQHSLNDLAATGCSFISCFIEEKGGKLIVCKPNINKDSSLSNTPLIGINCAIGENLHINDFIQYLLHTNKKILSAEKKDHENKYRFLYKSGKYIDIDYGKYPIEFKIDEKLSAKVYKRFFHHFFQWLQSQSKHDLPSEKSSI